MELVERATGTSLFARPRRGLRRPALRRSARSGAHARQGDRLRPPGSGGERPRGLDRRAAGRPSAPGRADRAGPSDLHRIRRRPPTLGSATTRSRSRRPTSTARSGRARQTAGVLREPDRSGRTPVTCLGCGCACDDLTVQVADGRIVDVAPPCPLARRGSATARCRNGRSTPGRTAALEAAHRRGREDAAGAAGRVLVILAPDVERRDATRGPRPGRRCSGPGWTPRPRSRPPPASWPPSGAGGPRRRSARSGIARTCCCSGASIRRRAIPATSRATRSTRPAPTCRRAARGGR